MMNMVMRRKSVQQVLVVLVGLLQCMKCIGGCLEGERQALLKLKQAFVDDYGYFSSWGTEDKNTDCCEWNRVLCNNGTSNNRHVVKLDLHSTLGMPLRGELSPSVLDLPYLKYLDLSCTGFESQGLPNLLGSLSKLRYLNLSRAGLGKTSLYQIGNLTSLQTLDLSYNPALKFENLQWLSHLSSLEHLDMGLANLSQAFNWFQEISMLPSLVDLSCVFCSLNDVAPPLPSYFNISKSLLTLDLSMNNLTTAIFSWLPNISTGLVDLRLKFTSLQGPLPDAFWNMTSLEILDLSWNKLEGGIPQSMKNLCSLRRLDLQINLLSRDLIHITNTLFEQCSTNTLEYLSLRHNQFSGSLPDFTTFSSLRELYLDTNQLNGSIPASFVHISSLVILDFSHNRLSGQLPHLSKSLIALKLSSNQLNGSIGTIIGQLPNLVYLFVSSNHFEGVISQVQFSNSSFLQHLDLSFNSLTINLSSSWVPSFQLRTLRLSSCNIGNKFPEWLQTQKNLSQLDVANTEISGVIPHWFWVSSPNLRYLNLSDNQISGMIPSSSLKSVKWLDLSSNHFEGPIPQISSDATVLDLSYNMFSGSILSICYSEFLGHVDLSDNLLSGEIPDCWTPMIMLSVLRLSNNNFSGRIPNSIGSLAFLATLHLYNNSLSGEVPLSLKKCGQLILVDLGENMLTGEIPAWLGEGQSMLIVLSLRSNAFYGSIPSQLCHLPSVRILDLSHNSISGTIPWCFGNLSAMARKNNTAEPITYGYLYGGYVENVGYVGSFLEKTLVAWKGRQYEYAKSLALFKIVDLSSNNLCGEIPREITSLVGLVALNLSRNGLTGNIPAMIGELNLLQSLDFSNNSLSGIIPSTLSNLNFLQVLDLSNNDLFGEIPSGTQLQSFDASSYSGNPNLCGPPLVKKCRANDAGPPSHETNSNRDENWHGIPWFYVSAAIGFVVGFWGVCFSLIFIRPWRYAYFGLVDQAINRLYVMTERNWLGCKAKLRGKFLS